VTGQGQTALQWLGRAAAALGFLVIAMNYAPMLWLGLMSFSLDPMSGIPGAWTGQWYDQLFADRRWSEPLLGSILMGALVGVICAAVGLVVARALVNMVPQWRGRLIGMFLLPLLVPGVLLGAGLFIYLRVFLTFRLGWWSIFVAHFVWAFPFALLAVLISVTRYDHRLSEVAADLGASPWRRFMDVELPFVMPGLVSAFMFGFLFSFSELSRSVLLRGGKTTLPIFEWVQASAHSSSVPLIYALSTIELVCSGVVVIGSFWFLFGRRR
jgi:ABC-type spermidine/putrescine transport system permease subunit II